MQQVIHEYDKSSRHRIVVIDDTGKRTEGRWAPYQGLAQVKGYYAAGPYFEGVLPVGVFRLNVVPHVSIAEDEVNTYMVDLEKHKGNLDEAIKKYFAESNVRRERMARCEEDQLVELVMINMTTIRAYCDPETSEWLTRQDQLVLRTIVREVTKS